MGRTTKAKCTCFYCGKEYVDTNYHKSNSEFYINIGKIPYCKQCIEKFYQYYYEKYTNEGCLIPEKKAVKKLCMFFDVYYVDKVFNSVMQKAKESSNDISIMGQYMRIIQLQQYNLKNETYDNTMELEEKEEFINSFGSSSEIRKADKSKIDPAPYLFSET